MADIKNTRPDDQIKKYDSLNLVVNNILIPITFFFGIFLFYTSGTSMIQAEKNIKYGNEILTETYEALPDQPISFTNRWLENTIKIRKDKLAKLEEWSKEDKTKELKKFQTYYEKQIPTAGEMDYHRIAMELAGLANKQGVNVRILGISIGSPRLSKNVIFKADPRYQIFETPVTIDFEKNGKFKFKSYEQLTKFLEDARNNIKMPFDASFEVSKGDLAGEEIKLGRITFMFFYKHKK